MVKARTVYDGFLAEFPLCYGYWKKYADLELKKSGPAACETVYERGVTAVAYSVELWVHYTTFARDRKTPETIRR